MNLVSLAYVDDLVLEGLHGKANKTFKKLFTIVEWLKHCHVLVYFLKISFDIFSACGVVG